MRQNEYLWSKALNRHECLSDHNLAPNMHTMFQVFPKEGQMGNDSKFVLRRVINTSCTLHSVIFTVMHTKFEVVPTSDDKVIFRRNTNYCKNDDQREITQRQNAVEFLCLSTALLTNATNTNAKCQVSRT